MVRMTDLSAWWPLPGAEGLRAHLEAAYADPSRGYHDTLHLREVLERLDELGPAAMRVVLAAWFHDAVYDGRPDAEERSAQLGGSRRSRTPAPTRRRSPRWRGWSG